MAGVSTGQWARRAMPCRGVAWPCRKSNPADSLLKKSLTACRLCNSAPSGQHNIRELCRCVIAMPNFAMFAIVWFGEWLQFLTLKPVAFAGHQIA